MLRSRFGLGLVFALAAGLAIPYFALERETRALDDEARQARDGSYVELEDGATHYELLGPPEAPVVVLIHGGTIPLFAWDAQVPALLDAGFRVLRYTQYGRGYSDRPAVRYDRALYQRQLSGLLESLDIEGPVSLFGVSFGAATAAMFTLANPDRVDRLVFIAPVVDYSDGRALFGLAKVPLVSEWFVRVFAVPGAVKRASGFFEQANAPPKYAAWFDEQTRFEGFERALLSFSRTDALRSYTDVYAALGAHPKLLIWGAEDSEIPRRHIDFLRSALTNLTYAEIQSAGHGVSVEHQAQVNHHLTTFMGTRTPQKTPSIPTP